MKIGKYKVQKEVAKGEFASVLQAVEPVPPHGLGRKVALKLCTSRDQNLRQRFAHEAKMLASLGQHPNITNAYDMGFHEGEPFLVEEYLSGEDLRHKIDRSEPFALAVKVRYLLQVAKGLEYAHSKGIIHRDIKPENIRVLEDDHVKILDFGIGRITGGDVTRLTVEGTVMGTVGYLAPEQLRGTADERSDIFAFAVVAYELLTSRHPFEAESLAEQLQGLMRKDPAPITDSVPGCAAELSQLIHRCLAKNPDNRPQDFAEVLTGLRQVLPSAEAAAARDDNATVVLDVENLRELAAEAEVERATEPPQALSDTTVHVEPANPSTPAPAAAPPVPVESMPRSARYRWRLADLWSRAQPTLKTARGRLSAAAVLAEAALARWLSGARKLRWSESSQSARNWFAQHRLKIVPVAVLGLALIVALAIWPSGSDEASPPLAVVEPAAAVPDPAVAMAIPTGRLFVDAFPWARVDRVLSQAGTELALTEACVTPCSLELAADAYRVYLKNDDFPEVEEICDVVVSDLETAICRARFAEVTALEYFKESGWWN